MHGQCFYIQKHYFLDIRETDMIFAFNHDEYQENITSLEARQAHSRVSSSSKQGLVVAASYRYAARQIVVPAHQ